MEGCHEVHSCVSVTGAGWNAVGLPRVADSNRAAVVPAGVAPSPLAGLPIAAAAAAKIALRAAVR